MKQYVIDELRPEDFEKLKAYLEEHYAGEKMDGLYWLLIGDELLTEVQTSHNHCKPFYFALELTPDRLSCELLVRSKNQLRCGCIAYANQDQRNWIIRKVDAMVDTLGLIT
ncbi:MAG: hypothetical protein HKM93_20685 [Desulfobacteraceae bacterium]|nr:hypothetical protein [Desulfobacteraceae bacterium]